MKKVLAMLGLALTVLISTPAVHAATVDSGTYSAPVIIRDVTTPVDSNTVIIRDIQASPNHTVIIRDLSPNFTPDWGIIIRDIMAAHPEWNVVKFAIRPNTVIIRDITTAPTADNTSMKNATVIIRD
jgi:hypothetical protein